MLDDDDSATGSTRWSSRSSPATRCGSTSRCMSSRAASATAASTPSVAANGTYFTNGVVARRSATRRAASSSSAADRREHGLAPRPLIPSLDDVEARKPDARRRDRLRGGRGHGRGPGRRRAGGAAPDLDGRRAPLLPLRDRWPDRRASTPSSPPTTRCMKRSGGTACRDPDLPSPGAHRAPGAHGAERPGLAGLLHRAVRSVSVPPPQRRGASRRRHGDARRGQHDHLRGGVRPLESEGRPGASISRSRSWRTRWRTSGRVPYAFVEGGAGAVREPRLVLRDEGRGERHGGRAAAAASGFMRQPHPYPPIRRGEPLLRGLDPYWPTARAPSRSTR